MNDESPALLTPSTPTISAGSVVLGLTFIIVWTLAHVILFGLSFASGLVLDILLMTFKNLTLPGLVANNPGMEMAWMIPLQIGVVLTGLAGVPAGLAMFWHRYRKRLWLTSGILLLAGLAVDGYAIFRIFSDAFQGLQ